MDEEKKSQVDPHDSELAKKIVSTANKVANLLLDLPEEHRLRVLKAADALVLPAPIPQPDPLGRWIEVCTPLFEAYIESVRRPSSFTGMAMPPLDHLRGGPPGSRPIGRAFRSADGKLLVELAMNGSVIEVDIEVDKISADEDDSGPKPH